MAYVAAQASAALHATGNLPAGREKSTCAKRAGRPPVSFGRYPMVFVMNPSVKSPITIAGMNNNHGGNDGVASKLLELLGLAPLAFDTGGTGVAGNTIAVMPYCSATLAFSHCIELGEV